MTDYSASSPRAAKAFGQNKETNHNGVPLLGFEYFVRVNFNPEAVSQLPLFVLNVFAYDPLGYSVLVKSVDLPSFDIDTEVLYSYNRKRISQKKINYKPVKIVFHESADGKTSAFWQAYYTYYFKDGDPQESLVEGLVQKFIGTTPLGGLGDMLEQDTVSAENFGYNVGRVQSLPQLINSIDIYQVKGTYYNQVKLHNPKITAYDSDTMEYSSNELVSASFTFEYEYVDYFNQVDVGDSTFDAVLNNNLGMQEFFELGAPSLDFDMGIGRPPNRSITSKLLGGNISDIYSSASKEMDKDTLNNERTTTRNPSSASALGNSIVSSVPLGTGVNQIETPVADVRSFTTSTKTSEGYNDVDRITKEGNTIAENETNSAVSVLSTPRFPRRSIR